MPNTKPCPYCSARSTNMGICARCGGYVCVFCEARMAALEAPGHIIKEHQSELLFTASHDDYAFHFWLDQHAPRCQKCGEIMHSYAMCLRCNKFTAADRAQYPPVRTIQGIIADEPIPSDKA